MGTVMKVDAVYPEPVLARGRAHRPGGGRHGARPGDLRQHAARRAGPGSSSAFVEAEAARSAWARSRDDLRRAGARELQRLLRPPGAPARPSFHVPDWQEELWTRGCPVASPPPACCSTTAARSARRVDRIHWAGTETVDLLERLHGRRGALGRARGEGGPRRAAPLTLGVRLLRDSFPERPGARHRGLARAARARRRRRRSGRPFACTARRRRSPSGASTRCGRASPRRATRRATPASSRSSGSPAATRRPTTRSRSSTRRSRRSAT